MSEYISTAVSRSLEQNVTRVKMYTRTALDTRLLLIQVTATPRVVSLDTRPRESIYSRETHE